MDNGYQALNEDVVEIKSMLKDHVEKSGTYILENEKRITRLEEQNKLARWLVGGMGLLAIGIIIETIAARIG